MIEIQGLGKKYRIGNVQPYLSLRDSMAAAVKNLFSPRERKAEFWALQEIDISIAEGERIGIIGRNGAGKSTLLKIISRITPPTKGQVTIWGNVASLLEVGTGFHPELTGRENIYLNGAILGLSRTMIRKKLDEIVAFSGVEKFIDTPLKHYSSGMQLRLAFSVAAHLEPEVLLIDEVLAVGDLEFQKKCMAKMEDVSRKEGRTILFVSHNLSAISTLTEKTIFLDKGKMACFDKTAVAITAYLQANKASSQFTMNADETKPAIRQVHVQTSEPGNVHAYGMPLSIVFDVYMPEKDVPNMALAFQVVNQQLEQPVLHQWLFDVEKPSFRRQGSNRVRFTFPSLKLYKGDYYLKVHLAESKNKVKFAEAECCHFTVDMLNLAQPEWGWYENMCLYLESGTWEQI